MLKSIFKKAIVSILTLEARAVLNRYKPHIIAVTGSVGKTSTKDAIYAILQKRDFVRKSEKSFNSEIGVPLTILGLPNAWDSPFGWTKNFISGILLILWKRPYPHTLILEVGADRPGDIKNISSWLHPDVAVVTRFALVPAHIEYFSSVQDVVNEKAELVKAVKDGGILVLSKDDPSVASLSELVRREVVTFGCSREAQVSGSLIKFVYTGRGLKRKPKGLSFKIRYGAESVLISSQGSIGKPVVCASLAAAAVAVSIGIRLEDIGASLTAHANPPGRMKILEGVDDSIIIDDTYNSSPVAAREALDSLSDLKTKGRKIAVLGDMLELGRFSISEHKSIGAYAALKADFIVAVGVRARDIAIGALESGKSKDDILEFDDSREAGQEIHNFIKTGDVILVKGSQAVRMERVVEALMAHPEEKGKLLVRQEEEWMRR